MGGAALRASLRPPFSTPLRALFVARLLSSRGFACAGSWRRPGLASVMFVLVEASAKSNLVAIRSKAGPFVSGRSRPASSYPGEREAPDHHALVRQGRGPKRQVQILTAALKPEPGAAHCRLGAVRKRRGSLSSSSRLFRRLQLRPFAGGASLSAQSAARRREPRRSQPSATARSRVCASARRSGSSSCAL